MIDQTQVTQPPVDQQPVDTQQPVAQDTVPAPQQPVQDPPPAPEQQPQEEVYNPPGYPMPGAEQDQQEPEFGNSVEFEEPQTRELTPMGAVYGFLKAKNPELLGGLDEERFVDVYSDPDKASLLFDFIEKKDKDLLGGITKNRFLETYATPPDTIPTITLPDGTVEELDYLGGDEGRRDATPSVIYLGPNNLMLTKSTHLKKISSGINAVIRGTFTVPMLLEELAQYAPLGDEFNRYAMDFMLRAANKVGKISNRQLAEQLTALHNAPRRKRIFHELEKKYGTIKALKEYEDYQAATSKYYTKHLSSTKEQYGWGAMLEQLSWMVAESAPATVIAMATGGAAGPISLGVTTATNKFFDKIDPETGEISPEDLLNSLITGASEAVTEMVTLKIGKKAISEMIETFGKSEAKGRIAKSLWAYLGDMARAAGVGAAFEGGSEAINSLVESGADILVSGEDLSAEEVLNRIIDAGAAGAASGGGIRGGVKLITAPFDAAARRRMRRNEELQEKVTLLAKEKEAAVTEAEAAIEVLKKESKGEASGLTGVKSFETAKGSVYTVTEDGKTQRYKTATGQQMRAQDLMVFFKAPVQKIQDFLAAIHTKGNGLTTYVVEAGTNNVIRNNEEGKGKTLELVVMDAKTKEVVDRITDVVTTPTLGYNTYDQTSFVDPAHNARFTERHIGNEVTKINPAETGQPTGVVRPQKGQSVTYKGVKYTHDGKEWKTPKGRTSSRQDALNMQFEEQEGKPVQEITLTNKKGDKSTWFQNDDGKWENSDSGKIASDQMTQRLDAELGRKTANLTTTAVSGRVGSQVITFEKKGDGRWLRQDTGEQVPDNFIPVLEKRAEMESKLTPNQKEQKVAFLKQQAKELEEAEATVTEEKVNTLRGQFKRMAQILANVVPGIKVEVYRTVAEYEGALASAGGAVKSWSGGFYNPKTKTVHVNAPVADDNIVFHETGHPLLDVVFALNPGLKEKFFADLERLANSNKEIRKYIEFGEKFYAPGKSQMEALVEFVADVVSGKVDPSVLKETKGFRKRVVAAIRNIINSMFGIKPKIDNKSLIDFATSIRIAYESEQLVETVAETYLTGLESRASLELSEDIEYSQKALKVHDPDKAEQAYPFLQSPTSDSEFHQVWAHAVVANNPGMFKPWKGPEKTETTAGKLYMTLAEKVQEQKKGYPKKFRDDTIETLIEQAENPPPGVLPYPERVILTYKRALRTQSIRERLLQEMKHEHSRVYNGWIEGLQRMDIPYPVKYALLDAVISYVADGRSRSTGTITPPIPFIKSAVEDMLRTMPSQKPVYERIMDAYKRFAAAALENNKSETQTNGGVWLTFPSSQEAPLAAGLNAEYVSGIAQGTSLCASYMADSFLKSGNFYYFVEVQDNGLLRPLVAIRLEGNKVREVAGAVGNTQAIQPQYLPAIVSFLDGELGDGAGTKWKQGYDNRKSRIAENAEQRRAANAFIDDLLPGDNFQFESKEQAREYITKLRRLAKGVRNREEIEGLGVRIDAVDVDDVYDFFENHNWNEQSAEFLESLGVYDMRNIKRRIENGTFDILNPPEISIVYGVGGLGATINFDNEVYEGVSLKDIDTFMRLILSKETFKGFTVSEKGRGGSAIISGKTDGVVTSIVGRLDYQFDPDQNTASLKELVVFGNGIQDVFGGIKALGKIRRLKFSTTVGSENAFGTTLNLGDFIDEDTFGPEHPKDDVIIDGENYGKVGSIAGDIHIDLTGTLVEEIVVPETGAALVVDSYKHNTKDIPLTFKGGNIATLQAYSDGPAINVESSVLAFELFRAAQELEVEPLNITLNKVLLLKIAPNVYEGFTPRIHIKDVSSTVFSRSTHAHITSDTKGKVPLKIADSYDVEIFPSNLEPFDVNNIMVEPPIDGTPTGMQIHLNLIKGPINLTLTDLGRPLGADPSTIDPKSSIGILASTGAVVNLSSDLETTPQVGFQVKWKVAPDQKPGKQRVSEILDVKGDIPHDMGLVFDDNVNNQLLDFSDANPNLTGITFTGKTMGYLESFIKLNTQQITDPGFMLSGWLPASVYLGLVIDQNTAVALGATLTGFAYNPSARAAWNLRTRLANQQISATFIEKEPGGFDVTNPESADKITAPIDDYRQFYFELANLAHKWQRGGEINPDGQEIVYSMRSDEIDNILSNPSLDDEVKVSLLMDMGLSQEEIESIVLTNSLNVSNEFLGLPEDAITLKARAEVLQTIRETLNADDPTERRPQVEAGILNSDVSNEDKVKALVAYGYTREDAQDLVDGKEVDEPTRTERIIQQGKNELKEAMAGFSRASQGTLSAAFGMRITREQGVHLIKIAKALSKIFGGNVMLVREQFISAFETLRQEAKGTKNPIPDNLTGEKAFATMMRKSKRFRDAVNYALENPSDGDTVEFKGVTMTYMEADGLWHGPQGAASLGGRVLTLEKNPNYRSYEGSSYRKRKDGSWLNEDTKEIVDGNSGEAVLIESRGTQMPDDVIFRKKGDNWVNTETGEVVPVSNKAGSVHRRLETNPKQILRDNQSAISKKFKEEKLKAFEEASLKDRGILPVEGSTHQGSRVKYTYRDGKWKTPTGKDAKNQDGITEAFKQNGLDKEAERIAAEKAAKYTRQKQKRDKAQRRKHPGSNTGKVYGGLWYTAKTINVWRRALKLSALNPNERTRIEDLMVKAVETEVYRNIVLFAQQIVKAANTDTMKVSQVEAIAIRMRLAVVRQRYEDTKELIKEGVKNKQNVEELQNELSTLLYMLDVLSHADSILGTDASRRLGDRREKFWATVTDYTLLQEDLMTHGNVESLTKNEKKKMKQVADAIKAAYVELDKAEKANEKANRTAMENAAFESYKDQIKTYIKEQKAIKDLQEERKRIIKQFRNMWKGGKFYDFTTIPAEVIAVLAKLGVNFIRTQAARLRAGGRIDVAGVSRADFKALVAALQKIEPDITEEDVYTAITLQSTRESKKTIQDATQMQNQLKAQAFLQHDLKKQAEALHEFIKLDPAKRKPGKRTEKYIRDLIATLEIMRNQVYQSDDAINNVLFGQVMADLNNIAEVVRAIGASIDDQVVKDTSKRLVKMVNQHISTTEARTKTTEINNAIRKLKDAMKKSDKDPGKAQAVIDAKAELLRLTGRTVRPQTSPELKYARRKLQSATKDARELYDRIENRGKKGKLRSTLGRGVDTLFDSLRAIKVTADLSASLLQAYLPMTASLPRELRQMVTNPILERLDGKKREPAGSPVTHTIRIAGKEVEIRLPTAIDAYLYAGHTAVKSLWNITSGTKQAHEYFEQIASDPFYPIMERAGIEFTLPDGLSESEEFFRDGLVKAIPVFRNLVHFSENHMVTILNFHRFAMFRSWMIANPMATLEEQQEYARWVNTLTGRSSSKLAEGPLLKYTFLAPQLTLSRANYIGEATFYTPMYALGRAADKAGVNKLMEKMGKERRIGKNNAARNRMAMDVFNQLLSWSILFTTMIAAGATFGDDPREGDFLKLQFGGQRIDFGAGLTPLLRFMAGAWVLASDAYGYTQKSPEKSDEFFNQTTIRELLSRMTQFKYHPTLQTALNLFSGKNTIGQDEPAWVIAYTALSPIVAEVMFEFSNIGLAGISGEAPVHIDAPSIGEAFIYISLSSHGAGVSAYRELFKEDAIEQFFDRVDYKPNPTAGLPEWLRQDKYKVARKKFVEDFEAAFTLYIFNKGWLDEENKDVIPYKPVLKGMATSIKNILLAHYTSAYLDGGIQSGRLSNWDSEALWKRVIQQPDIQGASEEGATPFTLVSEVNKVMDERARERFKGDPEGYREYKRKIAEEMRNMEVIESYDEYGGGFIEKQRELEKEMFENQ